MPNPFNKKKTESTAAGTVAVLNSCLVCEYCYAESTEGTYHPEVKKLVWDCDGCGRTNIVSNIEL